MVSSFIIKTIQGMIPANPLREICGIIDEYDNIYPIRNVSRIDLCFVFDKFQYFKVVSKLNHDNIKIKAIYHSHPVSPEPSGADLGYIRRSKIPSLIVTKTEYKWVEHA